MNIHDVSQGPVPRPQYVRTVQRYVQCRVDHHKRGAVLGTVQGHYVPNGVCFDQSRSIDWYLQYRKGHMRAFERIGVLKLSILDERSVIRGPSCSNVNADIPCWCRDWHDRIVRLFCALADLQVQNFVYSIVTTPTELVKIRQQALLTPISTHQMLRRIIRQDGIRGLYRGITATGLRDIGYGSYFFAVSLQNCPYGSTPPFQFRTLSTKQLADTFHSLYTRILTRT